MKLTLDGRLPVVIVGSQASKFNNQTEHDARLVIYNLLLGTHRTVPPEMKMLATYKKLQLITGACHKGGIDIWAQEEAERASIPVTLFKPQVRQWPDKVTMIPFNENEVKQHKMDKSQLIKRGYYYYERYVQIGYKSRNDQMAICGSIGFDIEPAGSCRHCGGKGFTWSGLVELECRVCKGTGAYSGGRYTINKMISLGKEGHIIVIN